MTNKKQELINQLWERYAKTLGLLNATLDELDKKPKEVNTKTKKINNLTKEIEYVTSNDNGDTFKIFAMYGKTNLENTNILDLEKVDGIISSLERSKIYITSDFAKYNYSNQNSKFYTNVVIKYDNKKMTCDYLDLEMKKRDFRCRLRY